MMQFTTSNNISACLGQTCLIGSAELHSFTCAPLNSNAESGMAGLSSSDFEEEEDRLEEEEECLF